MTRKSTPKKAGPLPHKSLKAFRVRKKQGTRLLKCECEECGYVVRTTAKWLAVGAPYCTDLDHGQMKCDKIETEKSE